MSQTNYIISQNNLLQLAEIASDIDSLKSAQPNGWQAQCVQLISAQHHIIDAVLGADAGLAYVPEPHKIYAVSVQTYQRVLNMGNGVVGINIPGQLFDEDELIEQVWCELKKRADKNDFLLNPTPVTP